MKKTIFLIAIILIILGTAFACAALKAPVPAGTKTSNVGGCSCKAEINGTVGVNATMECVVNQNNCPVGQEPACSTDYGQCGCSCKNITKVAGGKGATFVDWTKDCFGTDGSAKTIIDKSLFKFYARGKPCKTGCDNTDYACTPSCPSGYEFTWVEDGISRGCSRSNQDGNTGACVGGCSYGFANTKCWSFCQKTNLHLDLTPTYKSCSNLGDYYAAWRDWEYDSSCWAVYMRCASGWVNCDNNWDNGCEVQLGNDNCGSCGNKCGASSHCDDVPYSDEYACYCNQDYGDCDKDKTNGCEVSFKNALENCGLCGNSCSAKHTATCSNGGCTGCVQGYAECDSNKTNGCETEIKNNEKNCGSCGNICSEDAYCSNSKCVNGTYSKAIHFSGASGRIENNQINIEKGSLPAVRHAGIYLESSNDVEMANNKIRAVANDKGMGAYIENSQNIVLTGNNVAASKNAVLLYKSVAIGIKPQNVISGHAINISPIKPTQQAQSIPANTTACEQAGGICTTSISCPSSYVGSNLSCSSSMSQTAPSNFPAANAIVVQPQTVTKKCCLPIKPSLQQAQVTFNSNFMCASETDIASKNTIFAGSNNIFTESSGSYPANFKSSDCYFSLDSCQKIDVDNNVYTLTKDVESQGTCFEMNGLKNIIFNCQGKKIKYAKTADGYGIDIKNGNGITVTNCVFEGPYSMVDKRGYSCANNRVCTNAIDINRGQDVYINSNKFSGGGGVSFTDIGSTYYENQYKGQKQTSISYNNLGNGSIYGVCKNESELYNRMDNSIGPLISGNTLTNGAISVVRDTSTSPKSVCGSPIIMGNKITGGSISTWYQPCGIYSNEIDSPKAPPGTTIETGILVLYDNSWKQGTSAYSQQIGQVSGNTISIGSSSTNKNGMFLTDITNTYIKNNIVVNKGNGAGVKFQSNVGSILFNNNIVCKNFNTTGGSKGGTNYYDIDCSSISGTAGGSALNNVFSNVTGANKCTAIVGG